MIIYAQLPSNPPVLLNLMTGSLEIREDIPPLPSPSPFAVLWKATKIRKRFARLRNIPAKRLRHLILSNHSAIVTPFVYKVSLRRLCKSIPQIQHLWVITNKNIIYFKVGDIRKLPTIYVGNGILGRNYAVVF